MKTILKAVCAKVILGFVVMAILPLFCFASHNLAEERIYAYTTVEEQAFVIDLMDQPDDAGNVLFRYYPGVRVEPLSDAEDGWLHVRVCNIDGYMKVTQIDFSPEHAEAPHMLPVSVIKGKTDYGEVNFRELPTVDIPSLGYCYTGKEVHVLGIGDEWCHLIIDGRMGFMKTQFLEDTGTVTESVIGPFQSPIR